MPSMSEIVAEHTALADEVSPVGPSAGLGVAAADLAFSDLALWVRAGMPVDVHAVP